MGGWGGFPPPTWATKHPLGSLSNGLLGANNGVPDAVNPDGCLWQVGRSVSPEGVLPANDCIGLASRAGADNGNQTFLVSPYTKDIFAHLPFYNSPPYYPHDEKIGYPKSMGDTDPKRFRNLGSVALTAHYNFLHPSIMCDKDALSSLLIPCTLNNTPLHALSQPSATLHGHYYCSP